MTARRRVGRSGDKREGALAIGRVLVTGASGFVGEALCGELVARGISVRGACRARGSGRGPPGVECAEVGDIGEHTEWREALEDVECVVHLAARVHLLEDRAADPWREYRRINTVGTRRLAEAACAAGVRRFLFLSTAKVHGEETVGTPFRERDSPKPEGGYAVSKLEAEEALIGVANGCDMEYTIIRPPLVYGPRVKANFLRLLQAVERRLPLPLGAIKNRRSLVGVSNLVDLIITGLVHPGARDQVFLASDDEDLASPELVRRIGQAMGKRPILVPVPPWALKLGARLFGKSAEVNRLCESMEVDCRKAMTLLGWRQPMTVDGELNRVARWFRGQA